MPPPVTARVLPTGYKLPEGFKVPIAFSLTPGLNIWEVDAPIAGADSVVIDTSTQLNTTWRTKWMSALKDSPEVSGTAGWDPSFYDQLVFLTGAQSGAWTAHLPTNASISYWGGLKSFQPQPHKFSTFPLINFTVINTNTNPTTGAEEGYVLTRSGGTP